MGGVCLGNGAFAPLDIASGVETSRRRTPSPAPIRDRAASRGLHPAVNQLTVRFFLRTSVLGRSTVSVRTRAIVVVGLVPGSVRRPFSFRTRRCSYARACLLFVLSRFRPLRLCQRASSVPLSVTLTPRVVHRSACSDPLDVHHRTCEFTTDIGRALYRFRLSRCDCGFASPFASP